MIAAFDPAQFRLHGVDGAHVYQINTYSSAVPQPDTPVDDLLEIHVSAGDWQ